MPEIAFRFISDYTEAVIEEDTRLKFITPFSTNGVKSIVRGVAWKFQIKIFTRQIICCLLKTFVLLIDCIRNVKFSVDLTFQDQIILTNWLQNKILFAFDCTKIKIGEFYIRISRRFILSAMISIAKGNKKVQSYFKRLMI